jgi:hypothetical protein
MSNVNFDKPIKGKPLQILSLGAGVQSTALTLMAVKGEIAPPDCAIFADTGWEPKSVYEHLNKLIAVAPFPIHIVDAGNLRSDLLAGLNNTKNRFASIPLFLKMPDGTASMARRQCTSEYKLRPIYKKVVELLGGKRPKGGVEMWVGISTDEATRMKPARVQYIVNRWPLIEMEMSRQDCIRWMEKAEWTAPKSACLGCPFRSDASWRHLRDTDPEGWADAVFIDKSLREAPLGGLTGIPFSHRSLQPLDKVDLSTWSERGQADLFQMECEGMCGV